MEFYDVTKLLLDDIDAALTDTDGGNPDRVVITSGAIAWDECECGQLAASIGRSYLSDAFPAEQAAAMNCDAVYSVKDITIELIRCAPSAIVPALAPTPDALQDAARILVTDADIVRRTAYCTLQGLNDSYDIGAFLVRGQQSRGPEGGCVGTALRVSIGLLQGVL